MFCRTLILSLLFTFSLTADQNDSRLDNLFNLLLKTNNDIKINEIISNIWDIWHETNDPTIDADFSYGVDLMHNGNLNMSMSYFNKVIEKNSKFAEAWNKRATVHYMLGDFNSSLKDINETLKLEPRHFGAMDGMSLIFTHLQEFDKAIKVYDLMLTIFPNNFSIIQKRQRLQNLFSESI